MNISITDLIFCYYIQYAVLNFVQKRQRRILRCLLLFISHLTDQRDLIFFVPEEPSVIVPFLKSELT